MPPSAAAPVFRFAPSPNGLLHLGHAYSALVNERMARRHGGRLLLRIEDIDPERCRPEFEAAMIEDLAWLGIAFERPFRRQSEHLDRYRAALERLAARGLAYPAFMSRAAVRDHIAAREAGGAPWPRDPDGAPLYPPPDRQRAQTERAALISSGKPFAWRLDMETALSSAGDGLFWTETEEAPGSPARRIAADPAQWGDVLIGRRDVPTSYHLSVVLDDALQGVTHAVRGRDLFAATAVHRLLQDLLGLPAPIYHHHNLIRGPDGQKLSKSRSDTGLRDLRQGGVSAGDIRARLGFGD